MLAGELSGLRSDYVALQRRKDSVRVEFVRDTVIVSKRISVFRTLVDSIRHTDTLTVRESVIVAAADTAIRACRSVVRSCGESLRLSDSLVANREAVIRALRRSQPSALRRWSERIAWGAVGYTIGSLRR
jgi:hypothetical protein